MAPRTLPHTLEAEASVLGGVILRNDSLAELAELETDDFYDHKHKVVFEAMRNLVAQDKPIDVVMLEDEIKCVGKLEAIGGIAFLGELTLRVPTVENVRAYATIVRDDSMVRRLCLAAGEIVERTYEPGVDAGELVGEAMALIAKLDRAKPDSAVPVGVLAQRRMREIELQIAARQRGEAARLSGVPTGIPALDKRIGGYQFSIVNLLAGRPAMGKSAAAMAAVDAATAAGYAAHVFSQEDGWRAYADRGLSRRSKVAVEKIRNGDFTAAEAQALSHAMVALGSRRNWLVDERSGLSAAEIVRSVRRWKPQLDTKLVVVDYLQIVRRTPRLDENAALNEIMTVFAHAAKADDIAYLVLSQLNRDVEKRTDRRPQMSDLRGSGGIEEQSKIIVCPYRGAYYYDEPQVGIDYECDCPTAAANCPHKPSAEAFERLVQMLIIKNNNGQPGRVFASWNGATTEMS